MGIAKFFKHMLTVLFQLKYKSCYSAEIIFDPMSGYSRGYGFVRFWSRRDRDRAFSEMQGEYCGDRAMRIGPALRRRGFNCRQFSAIRFCQCGRIFPWKAGPIFRARKNGTNERRQDVGLRSSMNVRRKHGFPPFTVTRGSNISSR